MVIRGELDQQGTFNGNPLTMAAAKANLLEVMTPEAYGRFDELNAILARSLEACTRHGLPANVKVLGAKGPWSSVNSRSTSTATCGTSTTACRSSRGCGS